MGKYYRDTFRYGFATGTQTTCADIPSKRLPRGVCLTKGFLGASVYAAGRLLTAMCRRFTKPSKKCKLRPLRSGTPYQPFLFLNAEVAAEAA
jgi:hypothetical protein